MLRELVLFAGVGFAFFGFDELAVDAIFIGRSVWRRLFVFSRYRPATSETLPLADNPGRFAIFVPAWDETAVIEDMLTHLLAAYGDAPFDVFVGCYPNDRATCDAVKQVIDKRIHLVTGAKPGPTTKADCLNQIWRAVTAFESEHGFAYKGVVLHDAEDMVSACELRVFDWAIERFDLIQLPVIPVIDPASRWIGGHYCDEFAEAHGKTLVVREMLRAGVPSAGVGCAISTSVLRRIAEARGSAPFDADTLTEDYELGLRICAMGGNTAFVSLPVQHGREPVATRAHFPATLDSAVRQKTRWMIGIALAGWDRLGWRGGLGELWMRWRDRRAVLAAVLLTCGYIAALLFATLSIVGEATNRKLTFDSPFLMILLQVNLAFLLWRVAMRFWFVRRLYGWGEGLRSIPRLFVANIIAIMAARRAVLAYGQMLKSGKVTWDKTSHVFPVNPERL